MKPLELMRTIRTNLPATAFVIILVILSIGREGWANPPNRPLSDPEKGGYNFKDDARPWFDWIEIPYYREMFDGPGIKAQQEGTYQQFPQGAVPVKFSLGKIQSIFEPILFAEREIKPQNPTQATAESIARGQVLFNTYCSVCHGKTGKADTVVAQKSKGILYIPADLTLYIQTFGEPHLYNKIRYGSYYNTGYYYPLPGLMPSYGAQTSPRDRWDMVNYMKSENFGKEAK